jgi:adenosine deaminase
VGWGVAGDEAAPLAPYAELVAEAAAAGVHLVHHAGETAGPDSVREALGLGRAERIGHGIRSLEDPELVASLRDRRVPLEVCPSSNVALGLVPSLASHPLPLLIDAGLVVTLNTDILSVTGRTLSAEYAAVRDAFGCSDGELAAFARAGVDASYASPALKDELDRDIGSWLDGAAG